MYPGQDEIIGKRPVVNVFTTAGIASDLVHFFS